MRRTRGLQSSYNYFVARSQLFTTGFANKVLSLLCGWYWVSKTMLSTLEMRCIGSQYLPFTSLSVCQVLMSFFQAGSLSTCLWQIWLDSILPAAMCILKVFKSFTKLKNVGAPQICLQLDNTLLVDNQILNVWLRTGALGDLGKMELAISSAFLEGLKRTFGSSTVSSPFFAGMSVAYDYNFFHSSTHFARLIYW